MDRFTLCLEDGLLEKLDDIVAERGYPSRSQAMADFIRRAIAKKEFKTGRPCAAVISVMYPTGKKSPALEVEAVLEKHRKLALSHNTVFPEDGLAMLAVSAVGQADALQQFADTLRAIKGVTHGSFSIVSSL